MKVSIIIPTFNAEKYLVNLLNCIKSQTLENYELLIIDSSSKDRTIEIAKQYTNNIIIIPQNEFDHGGTRTKAAMKAKGEFLIFLTQDALPFNNDTFKNLLAVFEDKEVGAAYGKQLNYENTNIFGKHLREFNYTNNSYIRSKKDIPIYGIKTAFLSDSFACYRRDALANIGWFYDGLILGEDTYAGAKMILDGYKIAYVSNSNVYHSHSYTVWQEFKRYFDIGVFHKSEDWILQSFGKAEGEGLKYIKSEINYLIINKKSYLLLEFVIRNGMKYLGYKLGQKYDKLPMSLIKKISMHHKWWHKNNLK